MSALVVAFIRKYWKIIAIVLLILALFAVGKMYLIERQNRQRLGANQEVLLGDVRNYKLKDSSNVAVIGELTMKYSELKQSDGKEMAAMRDRIESMGIALRRVQSVAQANITTTTTIQEIMQDTALFEFAEPVKYLNASTKFNDVEIVYYPDNDSIYVRVITYDKMTQVVYKVRKGWPWKRSFWQPAKYEQAINFENPDTKIEYPKYIKISKR